MRYPPSAVCWTEYAEELPAPLNVLFHSSKGAAPAMPANNKSDRAIIPEVNTVANINFVLMIFYLLYSAPNLENTPPQPK
jgi:hypothetical protein